MLIFLYVLCVVLGFVAVACGCKYATGSVNVMDLILSIFVALTIVGTIIAVVVFMTSKSEFLDKRLW